jgi:hypothetical protein
MTALVAFGTISETLTERSINMVTTAPKLDMSERNSSATQRNAATPITTIIPTTGGAIIAIPTIRGTIHTIRGNRIFTAAGVIAILLLTLVIATA